MTVGITEDLFPGSDKTSDKVNATPSLGTTVNINTSWVRGVILERLNNLLAVSSSNGKNIEVDLIVESYGEVHRNAAQNFLEKDNQLNKINNLAAFHMLMQDAKNHGKWVIIPWGPLNTPTVMTTGKNFYVKNPNGELTIGGERVSLLEMSSNMFQLPTTEEYQSGNYSAVRGIGNTVTVIDIIPEA